MGQLTVVRWNIVIAGNVRTAAADVDLRSFQLVGLMMPAAWDAATIGFTSRPGHTENKAPGNDALQAVVDSDGTAFTVSAAAGKYVVFTTTEKEMASGLSYARIVASADQSADREVVGIVAARP